MGDVHASASSRDDGEEGVEGDDGEEGADGDDEVDEGVDRLRTAV